MNSKYIIILMLFFLSSSVVLSQNNNDSLILTVRIISSRVSFTDIVIDSISIPYFTRVYSPSNRKIPVEKYLYKCNLIIKLNGDSLLFREPVKVKCTLPNGHVQEELFNSECYPLNTYEFYDYSFDILSTKRINGWASIKLLKYFINEDNNNAKAIIEYDKATLFIQ